LLYAKPGQIFTVETISTSFVFSGLQSSGESFATFSKLMMELVDTWRYATTRLGKEINLDINIRKRQVKQNQHSSTDTLEGLVVFASHRRIHCFMLGIIVVKPSNLFYRTALLFMYCRRNFATVPIGQRFCLCLLLSHAGLHLHIIIGGMKCKKMCGQDWTRANEEIQTTFKPTLLEQVYLNYLHGTL
jgi:hypothetical protein